MKKLLAGVYSVLSYLVFLGSFLYAVGFLGGFIVPKDINSGLPASFGVAILVDLSLMTLFALQHSVMARPAFKAWWTKFIPKTIERSTYVLLSSLVLVFLYWQWIPMTGIVWQATDPIAIAILNAGFFIGWLIVLLSTFMINHFDLFGLKQVYEYIKSIPPRPVAFRVSLFYQIVRHPIMLGFIIAFWSTPFMTLGHLIFAIATTAYMLIAISYLEERDLLKLHGDSYRAYQQRVPKIIPFSKKRYKHKDFQNSLNPNRVR